MRNRQLWRRVAESGATLFVLWILGAAAQARPSEPSTPCQLEVDASDLSRRVIHSRMILPTAPGPLTLVYPRWIPGEHGPTGPLVDMAGLTIEAGGKRIAWNRNPIELSEIKCEVPAGADQVVVTLDYLAPPTETMAFGAGSPITAQLAAISWNQVLVYPKGVQASKWMVRPSLRLPRGWRLGTALRTESQSGERTLFAPVSLETLIDSPVLCGAHVHETPVGHGSSPAHVLVIAADSSEAGALPDDLKTKYDRLVDEAGLLFGSRPYDSYHFLLALSDYVAPYGLEHHQSSDNRTPERMLSDPQLRLAWAGLLPHEFVHSWNGKYRRPAEMIAADYQQPLNTELLWVYEGLTQYLGIVLTARSGLWTPEQTADGWAVTAQHAVNRRGRVWRPLKDTTTEAQLLYRARPDHANWRRGPDFYDEGALIWLEVDATLRRRSGGRASLDDFCRRFFGGQNGLAAPKGYTFDDVTAALNAIVPFEWKSLLEERLTSTSERPPLEGLKQSGWRLSYAEKPSELTEALAVMRKKQKNQDLTASIGFALNDEGIVVDVVPSGPVDRAGVAPGMKLVAVNSRRWSPEVLRAAVAATKAADSRLDLLLEDAEYLHTYTIDYHDGERYPRLERIADTPDVLSDILRPRGKSPKAEKQ